MNALLGGVVSLDVTVREKQMKRRYLVGLACGVMMLGLINVSSVTASTLLGGRQIQTLCISNL